MIEHRYKVYLLECIMQIEVIDDILSVEERADKIIEDAQKKARNMISSAHDKAAATIKEAVERVRERGKEDVESAEELLQNHLSEYEKERIEIEKSDETIDPAVLERATGRIVERICTVDAFGA